MTLKLSRKRINNPKLVTGDFKRHRPTAVIKRVDETLYFNISGYPKMRVTELSSNEEFMKEVLKHGTLQSLHSDALDLGFVDMPLVWGEKYVCTSGSAFDAFCPNIRMQLQ